MTPGTQTLGVIYSTVLQARWSSGAGGGGGGGVGGIEVQRIPPNDRTAYFHSLRVHVQVVVWSKLGENV